MNKDTYNRIRLGQNIRTRRLAGQMTQSELAARAGCSARMISRLEHGMCGISVRLLFELCRVLQCRLSELVEGV